MTEFRQSTRLKGKVNQGEYAEGNSSSDELSEAPTTSGKRKRGPLKTQSTTKSAGALEQRVQPPAKRRRGNRGVLERLIEMPIDLLFEIFGKLDPLDVLYMARASKDLRTVLMRKSSAFIWKEALSNVPDLPPCPDDLNEPAWIDLIYGKNCQFCGRNTPHQVTCWVGRLRGCTRCMTNNELMNRNDLYPLPHNLGYLLPSVTLNTGKRSRSAYHVHFPTYCEYKETYLQAGSKQKDWVKEKCKELELKHQHADLCKTWIAKQKQHRLALLEDAREERKEVILTKLKDSGYVAVDIDEWRESNSPDGQSFWGEAPIVQLLKKEITERAWSGVREKVLLVASEYRDKRRERVHKVAIEARSRLVVRVHEEFVKTRPIDEPVVPAADLFLSPEITTLLANFSSDAEMKLSDFDPVLPLLPAISARWESETKQKLLDMVKKHPVANAVLGTDAVPESALELAFLWFYCGGCRDIMDYRRALVHRCTTHGFIGGSDNPAFDLGLFIKQTQLVPWNYKNYFKFEDSASALKLLTGLGYDLKATTIQQMDDNFEIFECKKCSNDTLGRCMLDWRCAVDHLVPRPTCEPSIVKIDAKTTDIIRLRMEEALRAARVEAIGSYMYDHQVGLVCAHCRLSGNGAKLRKHLETDHKITSPTNADVVVLQDCKGRAPYRYWRPSDGPMTYF